jgi:peptidyl-prolyl cis-trans isomerase C
MRRRPLQRGLLAAVIALFATTAGSHAGKADAPAASASAASGAASAAGDTVVARVGPRTITLADVDRRIAAVPPFQLRYFGKTLDEIRRKFVEEGLVREALLAEGAEAEHMRDLPEVADRIRTVLRNALLAQVRAEAASQGPATDEEVRAYYEANHDKYHAPPRVALWRILVATREEALDVIEKAKADLSPKNWNELARERSLDKVTGMRGGNLGFVAPDGTTSDPNLKADPVLVQAADKVQDAQLVPGPVQEGSQWAVIWRRQSMKAVDRPLELEAPSIRQILMHERTEKKVKALLEELRKKYVTEKNAELVDLVNVSGQGDLQTTRRPGTLPSSRRPAPGAPAPAPNTNR